MDFEGMRKWILGCSKNRGEGTLRSPIIFALNELSGKFIVYLLLHLHYHYSSSSPLAIWDFVCLFGYK